MRRRSGRGWVGEAEDAPGRGQGHRLIEWCPDPGSQREIGPAAAVLPARAASRAQQPSGIQAAHHGGCPPSSSAAVPLVETGCSRSSSLAVVSPWVVSPE
jgi:hypothetical protein